MSRDTTTMDFVPGKVVLITGGASGIGLAMVKSLLQHGIKGVAIVDISEESGRKAVDEIVNTFGENKTVFIKADVTKKLELEGAFETTIKKYNQLDIVINNAGTMGEINWQQTLAVNLIAVIEGTYLAMQKYLPKYKSGDEGLIVNTASICGFQTVQLSPIYCTAKHGLIGLGKTLGGEQFYKTYKVRVLTICPGLVRTPLSERRNEILFPEIREQELRKLDSTMQSPERVGEGLIEVIKKGKSGSLWVIEDDKTAYEVVVPHYRTMKVSEL